MRNTRSTNSPRYSEIRRTQIGTHNFASIFYPINFTTQDRFVFFSTLWEKPFNSTGYFVGSKASRTLYGPMRNPLSNFRGNTNQKITQALNFLKKAAELEFDREQEFLQYHIKNNPELLEKLQNASEGDKYLTLIHTLNSMLKGCDVYKKQLDKEIARINTRREIQKLDEELKKKGRTVTGKNGYSKLTSAEYRQRDALNGDDGLGDTILNPYFNLDGEKIFNALFSNKSNFKVIVNDIITQYGKQLFSLKNGALQLNNRQLTVLLKLIVNKAYNMLILNFEGGVRRQPGETATARLKRIESNVKQLINENEEFNTFVNKIIESPNIGGTLNDIANQYGLPITVENTNKSSIHAIKERLKKAYQKEVQELKATEKDVKKTIGSFATWRKNIGASDSDLREMAYMVSKISAKAYYTNENESVVELAENAIFSVLNGNRDLTDDYLAGHLRIDLTYEKDDKVLKKVKTLGKKLSELERNFYQTQLQRTTTLQSYENNIEALRQLKIEEERQIQALQKEIQMNKDTTKEILSHIHIHGSIKGYASIDATTEAFAGASFGTTIEDQVEIIDSMMQSGGISIADKDWLIFALINCGKGMIGSKNKNNLEDYLSAFVGFLMFNDASLAVEDVSNFMLGNYTGYNVKDIHLYTLNNIYVPNSYILNETYKHLLKIYTNIESQERTHGFQVNLTTYNPPKTSGFTKDELSFLGKESDESNRWYIESHHALDETHLTMKFLSGFLDLLDSLSRMFK